MSVIRRNKWVTIRTASYVHEGLALVLKMFASAADERRTRDRVEPQRRSGSDMNDDRIATRSRRVSGRIVKLQTRSVERPHSQLARGSATAISCLTHTRQAL